MPRPQHFLEPVRLFCAAPQQPGSIACTFMTGLFRNFSASPRPWQCTDGTWVCFDGFCFVELGSSTIHAGEMLPPLDRSSGGLGLALLRAFCSLTLLYRLAQLIPLVGGQSLPMSKRSTIRSISLRLDLLAFGCLRRPSAVGFGVVGGESLSLRSSCHQPCP